MNTATVSGTNALRLDGQRFDGRRFSATALGLVALAHGGALWALLSMGVASLSTPPAALMVSLVQAEAAALPAHAVPPPRPQAEQHRAQPAPPPARQQPTPATLLATEHAQAAPTAELARTDKPSALPTLPANAAPAQAAANTNTNSAATAAVAPAATAPRFDADYLLNPAPAYPPLSRRAGEEGRVVLHVFVEANGLANKVELRSSSGFERLDKAAVAAVSRWKFVPAKQGADAVGAWVLVPLVFSLKI